MTETQKPPAAEKPARVKGLRLTVGGAPDTPHTIAGIPGLYRPNDPVPVGGPGELSEESAQGLHDDRKIPLELVDVKAGDVDRLRDQAEQDRLEAKGALGEALKDRRAAERAKATEQATSIQEGR